MAVSDESKSIDYQEEARDFFSVQIARYLEHCPSHVFSGLPEKDAVLGMIQDAWVELRASGVMNGLSAAGREALYGTTCIVFPTFVADGGLQCIPVDFVRQRRFGDQIIAVLGNPADS